MKKILESLEKLNSEIQEAKTTVAVLKSKREDALKRLKDEFGVKTIEEAKRLLKKKEEEVSKMKESIEKKYKTLTEEYQW